MKQLLILFLSIFSLGIQAGSKTAAASNDEVSTASTLMISPDYHCSNAAIGTFDGATRSAEFPCTAPLYSSYKDLWYKFDVTQSGKYAVSLTSPNGGSVSVFVFRQTGTTLTWISTGCLTRYTTLDLVAGETYYVSVASPSNTASFNLCVKMLPVSVNDEPTSAIQLSESTYNVCQNAIEGNTALATHTAASVCASAMVDVWYTFTPSTTGEYTFKRTFLSGSATTGVNVYSGTSGSLTALTTTCGEQIVLVNLTAGQTYYVAVSTSSPNSDPVYFSLCAYPSPPAPSNDACSNATSLTVGTSFNDKAVVADNTSGSVDLTNSPTPICGTLEFPTRGRDIWYTVTVPATGNFIIETQAVDGSLVYDTVMETYTGTCGKTTLIPYYYSVPPPNTGTTYCNEQFVIGGNQFAGIRFTGKTPGEKVYVRVWCWASQFGQFKISAYDDTVMATNDIKKNQVKVYPNPVHDVLSIQNNKEVKEVMVYDLSGKMMIKTSLNTVKGTINVSQLKTGVYVLKLIMNDSTEESMKMIKK